jgi:hypothetical protein
MTEYGVQPTGFVRKPMTEIMASLQAKMIEVFGPGVIQTPQSPLGQIIGVVADVSNEGWENALDTYQSFDVDAALQTRLDTTGQFQRMTRLPGESDEAFRSRISNTFRADIKLSKRINDIAAIDGVSFAWIIENSGNEENSYGMPPHSVAHAVIGGDDEDVAAVIYENAIGGIGLFGDYPVSIEADGFCRTVLFIRPIEVPIRVELDVRHIADACQCAPPSIGTITQFVIDAFAGECGYKNGDTVTEDRIVAETAQIGNMKIVDCRIAKVANSQPAASIATTIYERPVIISPNVIVRYV